MNTSYMLACGIVWRKTADPEAGWDLVEALESPDFCVRLLAQSLLVENGEHSMDLLENAVATGIVSPQAAGPCMTEILRGVQSTPACGQAIRPTREPSHDS